MAVDITKPQPAHECGYALFDRIEDYCEACDWAQKKNAHRDAIWSERYAARRAAQNAFYEQLDPAWRIGLETAIQRAGKKTLTHKRLRALLAALDPLAEIKSKDA